MMKPQRSLTTGESDPLQALALGMGMTLVPGEAFARTIRSLTCAERLEYAVGLSQLTGRLLFSLGFTLQVADGSVPRRLTRKDRAAAQAVVTEMARLRREMEDTLRHLEDWAESRVALTATMPKPQGSQP